MDGLEKEDAFPQKSPSFSNSQSRYSILHMLNFAVDASADRCVVLALNDEGGRRAREARKKREQTNVEGSPSFHFMNRVHRPGTMPATRKPGNWYTMEMPV